jgi:hypothetical protein
VGGGLPTLVALDVTAALPVERRPSHGAVLIIGLDVPWDAAQTKRLMVALVSLPPAVAIVEHEETEGDDQESHGFNRAVLLKYEVELSTDRYSYALETTCPYRPVREPEGGAYLDEVVRVGAVEVIGEYFSAEGSAIEHLVDRVQGGFGPAYNVEEYEAALKEFMEEKPAEYFRVTPEDTRKALALKEQEARAFRLLADLWEGKEDQTFEEVVRPADENEEAEDK